MELPAKKSLGQHFLNSRHVLGQIIEAARIQKGENVLEIGPGTGILTRALLDAGANVVAVEKDDRAFELLGEKFVNEIGSGRLKLVRGDILETREKSYELRDRSYEEKGVGKMKDHTSWLLVPSSYAVVANIPYYITGAILESFLEHAPRPNRMVLLVQKEVAERIVARDGKESVLSISVKAFGEPKIVAKVPRGAFTPPPKVDSAILTIENISDKRFVENNVDISRFFEILKAGFAHKRKFLKSNLGDIFVNNKSVWAEISIDEKVRAEDLPLEKWFEIVAKCRG